jgi:hypothetical protein
MSHLLLRYRRRGILGETLERVEEAAEEGDCRILEDMFRMPGVERGSIPHVGRGRAAVIAVNVLLPFTRAWAGLYSMPGLGAGALHLYRSYPATGENAIERHMRRQLGMGSAGTGLAIRQQGLIHVYRTLCSAGGCGSCALAVK